MPTELSKHVFISYAHNDNVRLGNGPGWVNDFYQRLGQCLRQSLTREKPVIWLDEKRLQSNVEIDGEILKALPETAVLVSLVSENYVASDYCKLELASFCDAARRTTGLAPGSRSRLFKVIVQPLDSDEKLPSELRSALGIPFFTRLDAHNRMSSDENDPPVPLDPGLGPPFENELNKSVMRLAQDVARTIRLLREATRPGEPTAVRRPTVYLALCGEDRMADRGALRSELLERGYGVLPQADLPVGEARLRDEVTRLLAESALAVHLVGQSPGLIPDGEGEDSVVAIQNQLAIQREQQGGLVRLVSLPDGTASKRPRHQAFIDALHADIAVQGRAELITGDLGKVKTSLFDALRRLEAPPPPPVVPDGETRPKVLVIFERGDRAASLPLRRALEPHAIVLKPVFDGTPAELREANERNLAAADLVLLFYGAGSEAWKSTVDTELRGARSLRDGRPAPPVFTWLAAPSTEDKDELRGGPRVIDAPGDFDPALLAPVVQSLKDLTGG